MICIVLVALGVLVPRIVPMRITESANVVENLFDTSSATRLQQLRKSHNLYTKYASPVMQRVTKFGSVAVVSNETVKAVALFRRDNQQQVTLLDLTSCDTQSGTLLMKGLVNTMNATQMRLGHSLEARWYVAHMYYRS